MCKSHMQQQINHTELDEKITSSNKKPFLKWS